MALSHNPRIVTKGLVFAMDQANIKSFKGAPTTNYAYSQNARIDESYASWDYTADATWLANHPGAIRVYNDAGSQITGYVNTGVNAGVWQTTHHAYWVYDVELRQPVVLMNDVDGQWKAKSFALGQSMTSMGLAVGDEYTISWLQWTDNIAKSCLLYTSDAADE